MTVYTAFKTIYNHREIDVLNPIRDQNVIESSVLATINEFNQSLLNGVS